MTDASIQNVSSQRENMAVRSIIIIPTYNEAGNIERFIKELLSVVPAINILIIDDNSPDNTGQIADRLALENEHIHVMHRQGKLGLGTAYIAGFHYAKEQNYEFVFEMDADFSHDPRYLPQFLEYIKEADLVIGSRYIPGGETPDWSLTRKIISSGGNAFTRFILGVPIHDCTSGFRCYRTSTVTSLHLEAINSRGYAFQVELVYAMFQSGFRVTELPIIFTDRTVGQSKMSKTIFTEAFRWVIETRLHGSPVVRKKDDDRDNLQETLPRLSSANGYSAKKMVGIGQPATTQKERTSPIGVMLAWIIPFVVLFLFLYKLMDRAFLSSSYFIGLPGDANQYQWFIGWVWYAIGQHMNPLITHAIDFPNTIHLMDYTSVPFIGLTFGWLYAFLGVERVYDIIFIVNYIVIFTFGKLSLREMAFNRISSTIGGLLFCLIPYLTLQEFGHLNLSFLAPNFFISYLLIRLFQRKDKPSWKTGIFLGLGIAASFYTSLETFATLTLFLLILLICGGIFAPRTLYTKVVNLSRLSFFVGTFIGLLLIVPGLLNFFEGQSSLTIDFNYFSSIYSNDILSFVLPSNYFSLHSYAASTITQQFTGNPTEWNGYLSIPFILFLIIYAARSWKSKVVRVFTCTATIFALLSLGPHLHIGGVITSVTLPWAFILHVPLFRDILPSRVALYTEIAGIIVIIHGFDKALVKVMTSDIKSRSLSDFVFSALMLFLIALCWLPIIPFPSVQIPQSATILSSDNVIKRFIGSDPTLVLQNVDANDFNYVEGVLASSNNYGMKAVNQYGQDAVTAPFFKVNQALTDISNPLNFTNVLRSCLPAMNVTKIIFISINNVPIDAGKYQQIVAYLGQPLYNRDKLVVVWNNNASSKHASARLTESTC